MKPLVAVTAWMEHARWLEFEGQVALLEEPYLRHIAAAGGVPAIVPPYEKIAGDIADSIDALIVGGGEDVDPARYGERPDRATVPAGDQRQDGGEIAITRAAIERGLPVLAICRGCQVLNVVYGGSLIQDLTARQGEVAHAAGEADPSRQTYSPHLVRAKDRSALAETLGAEFEVQSWHHQAIGRLGEGLEAVGTAEDGLVEAVSDPDRDFVLGVQWHPEVEDGSALFEALVAAAALARERRDAEGVASWS